MQHRRDIREEAGTQVAVDQPVIEAQRELGDPARLHPFHHTADAVGDLDHPRLAPDRAHPDLWRRFASGERGRTVAPLGGIRDRSSLALSASRMRQDTIFRDAAHHFLRQFDRSFQNFEKTASDGEIVAFTDTRTARAFMLLGRVSGTFD